jgi:hypothetical protein
MVYCNSLLSISKKDNERCAYYPFLFSKIYKASLSHPPQYFEDAIGEKHFSQHIEDTVRKLNTLG